MAGPTFSPYVSHPMSRVIIWPTIGLGLLTGCAAATSSANPADSLSALRPQYPSTYVRHPSAPVVIRNATILTAAGPELKNASIVFQDGKITAVGPNVTPPGNATVVDGGGKYVTPGIIDALATSASTPRPGSRARATATRRPSPSPREVWAEHSVWPQDPQIPRRSPAASPRCRSCPARPTCSAAAA